MSQDPDDKFLEVLAGRQPPTDADTRHAARLGKYFEMHPSAEELPRHDPQGEAQLLAYLRARPQATNPQHAIAFAPQAGLLQRARDWLFPASGFGLRQAGLALSVLGLAAVVSMQMGGGSDDDSSASMKRLPGTASSPSGVAAGDAVRTPDPAQAAATLQAELVAEGIPSTLEAQADAVVLRAQVPVDKRASVGTRLVAQGLVLPPDGQLKVRFQRGL